MTVRHRTVSRPIILSTYQDREQGVSFLGSHIGSRWVSKSAASQAGEAAMAVVTTLRGSERTALIVVRMPQLASPSLLGTKPRGSFDLQPTL